MLDTGREVDVDIVSLNKMGLSFGSNKRRKRNMADRLSR